MHKVNLSEQSLLFLEFFSRTIGKASSETRLYFVAPESSMLDVSAELVNLEGHLNVRASYLCSQSIYGDAIMASVGYTWRSKELFHEDISLQSYYRSLLMSSIFSLCSYMVFSPLCYSNLMINILYTLSRLNIYLHTCTSTFLPIRHLNFNCDLINT